MPCSNEDPLKYIQHLYPHISTFQPPDVKEIGEITDQLKSSASGHDGLSVRLLKQIKEFILMPLAQIISLSLNTGIVPADLKVAKVIPLFKAGDRQCLNNYRPISILPCFSKILEKVIHNRILTHLNNNSIFYRHQYGFGKNHSTYMALVHLVDSVTTALDKSNYTCSIFLDLSKAFDTVNHSILLAKLHKYGFQNIAFKWLQSYLSNRSQFVCIDGCNSDRARIHCGVPQGSILGPLLFLRRDTAGENIDFSRSGQF